MQPIVIFSHGFGVRGDSRGLFPEVIKGLGLEDSVMFDYGIYDNDADTITMPTLKEQVEKLQQVVAQAAQDHPGRGIVIIGHSAGCMITALADPPVQKVIMLAPPLFHAKRMSGGQRPEWPKVEIGEQEHRLHWPDGPVTIIKHEPERRDLDLATKINHLADRLPVTVVRATNDRSLGVAGNDPSGLSPKVKMLNIDTGHNFTGSARKELIELLRVELT